MSRPSGETGDPSTVRLEFAGEEGRVFGVAEIAGPGQAFVLVHEPPDWEWQCVNAGDVSIQLDGDGAELSCSEQDASLEATFAPSRAAGLLRPASLSHSEVWVTPGEVSGALALRDRRIDLRGYGRLWRRGPGEPSGGPVSRTLGVGFEDGRTLALVADRPLRAGGHGEEQVAAMLIAPDAEPEEMAGALLSTQYDGSGALVRAGLELHRGEDEDGVAMRAAGVALANGALELADRRSLRLGFFRWLLEGTPGFGVYEISEQATG